MSRERPNRIAADAIVDGFESLKPTEIRWLWENRIPRGKLTLLAGEPGIGKTMLLCDIAARMSRGDIWPDGRAGTPAGTIFITADHDTCDTLLPRVIAAGADLRSISLLRGVSVNDEEQTVKLTDVRAIGDALAQRRSSLIVVDPVSAFISGADSSGNTNVRAMLTPLADLAQRWNIGVVLVTHPSKRLNKSVLRSMGSPALIAMPRIVWLLAADKHRRGRRVLLPVKNNLCAKPTAMAFRVHDNKVVWEPDSFPVDADTFVEAQNSPELREQEAVEWLLGRLADGQWQPASDLFRLGSARAFNRRMIQRAAQELEIERKRWGQHNYNWRLPPSITHVSEETSLATLPR